MDSYKIEASIIAFWYYSYCYCSSFKMWCMYSYIEFMYVNKIYVKKKNKIHVYNKIMLIFITSNKICKSHAITSKPQIYLSKSSSSFFVQIQLLPSFFFNSVRNYPTLLINNNKLCRPNYFLCF